MQPVQANVGVQKPSPGRFGSGFQLSRCLPFFKPLFELAQQDVVFAQVVMKQPPAWIAPDSQPIRINRLVQVANGYRVKCGNHLPLALRYAYDLRESLSVFFGLPRAVSCIAVSGPKPYVSHREIRIYGDGPLKQGTSSQEPALAPLRGGYAVVLEGFQGTCGHLLQRTIQLLDRAARFSQLGAQDRRDRSQRLQYMLFVVGLDLLPRKCCAPLAGNRLDRDDVALTQA